MGNAECGSLLSVLLQWLNGYVANEREMARFDSVLALSVMLRVSLITKSGMSGIVSVTYPLTRYSAFSESE